MFLYFWFSLPFTIFIWVIIDILSLRNYWDYFLFLILINYVMLIYVTPYFPLFGNFMYLWYKKSYWFHLYNLIEIIIVKNVSRKYKKIKNNYFSQICSCRFNLSIPLSLTHVWNLMYGAKALCDFDIKLISYLSQTRTYNIDHEKWKIILI